MRRCCTNPACPPALLELLIRSERWFRVCIVREMRVSHKSRASKASASHIQYVLRMISALHTMRQLPVLRSIALYKLKCAWSQHVDVAPAPNKIDVLCKSSLHYRIEEQYG